MKKYKICYDKQSVSSKSDYGVVTDILVQYIQKEVLLLQESDDEDSWSITVVIINVMYYIILFQFLFLKWDIMLLI